MYAGHIKNCTTDMILRTGDVLNVVCRSLAAKDTKKTKKAAKVKITIS